MKKNKTLIMNIIKNILKKNAYFNSTLKMKYWKNEKNIKIFGRNFKNPSPEISQLNQNKVTYVFMRKYEILEWVR